MDPWEVNNPKTRPYPEKEIRQPRKDPRIQRTRARRIQYARVLKRKKEKEKRKGNETRRPAVMRGRRRAYTLHGGRPCVCVWACVWRNCPCIRLPAVLRLTGRAAEISEVADRSREHGHTAYRAARSTVRSAGTVQATHATQRALIIHHTTARAQA